MKVKVTLEQGDNCIFARATVLDNLIVSEGETKTQVLNDLRKQIGEFHPEISNVMFSVEWEEESDDDEEVNGRTFWDFCAESPIAAILIVAAIATVLIAVFV